MPAPTPTSSSATASRWTIGSLKKRNSLSVIKSFSCGYLAGSSRAAAAGCRAQTKAAATLTEPPRPLPLDHVAAYMATMVRCSGHCETRDGGRIASSGRHPTAEWVVQQLLEAFPEAGPYRYAILDHESKFDTDVIAFKEEPSSRADASLATRLRASICETPIVEYARTGRSCRSFNQFRASRTAGTLAESARPFPAGTDSLWVRLMEVPGKVLHDANVSACCILGKVRTLEFLEHRFA